MEYFNKGGVYDGKWKDGKRHGRGKMTFSNGRVYDGEWKGGKCHGLGKITYSDGREYDGEWKESTSHGRGKMTYSDGRVYDGEWEEGKRHGRGKMTSTAGEIVYDCEWKDGKRVATSVPAPAPTPAPALAPAAAPAPAPTPAPAPVPPVVPPQPLGALTPTTNAAAAPAPAPATTAAAPAAATNTVASATSSPEPPMPLVNTGVPSGGPLLSIGGITIAKALSSAATSVPVVTTVEANGTADANTSEPERQRVWDRLGKATALREADGVWTMRLPDGDVDVPLEHADLVELSFRKFFRDECIAADGFIDVSPPYTKLKVDVTGNGGGRTYTGLKNDTPKSLSAAFVRAHYKSWFLDKCANPDNCGRFIHVPIGAAEDRPNPSSALFGAPCEPASPSGGGFDSCRKPVKYSDEGKKGLCAPYGLASALHDLGACDNQGANLGVRIAKSASKLAKASGKGSGGNDKDAVQACVAEMRGAGWMAERRGRSEDACVPIERTFSATQDVSSNPTLVQLTEQHCVATLKDADGEWVYDSNEKVRLPLSHESLSRCMGAGRQYESGGAVRAYTFAPGKKAAKAGMTKRARDENGSANAAELTQDAPMRSARSARRARRGAAVQAAPLQPVDLASEKAGPNVPPAKRAREE